MLNQNEIVVFITAPNEDEAAEIAKALVKSKLAACVNIIKGIRSIYSWRGNLEDDSEVLMIVKTQKNFLPLYQTKQKNFTAMMFLRSSLFPLRTVQKII